jgi:hypothetical protein
MMLPVILSPCARYTILTVCRIKPTITKETVTEVRRNNSDCEIMEEFRMFCQFKRGLNRLKTIRRNRKIPPMIP